MQARRLAVRFCRVGVLVLALAARAAAAGDVIVVAPVAGPGVDFTEIDDAVAAAADDDTILIHAGTYDEPVTVTDKSLTIVARPGELVTISGPFKVLGLAAGRFVSLTGLKLTFGLVLEDDAGPVWVEDCSITGLNVFVLFEQLPEVEGGHGIEVADCANVTIVGTSVDGGLAANPGGHAYGGDGLRSAGSNVWFFDVDIAGGLASACFDLCAKVRGTGIVLTAGQLYAEGSSIEGQWGIDMYSLPVLWLLDTDVHSFGGGGTWDPIDGNGTVTELAGVERDFSINTPVEETDTLTLTFTGLEGDSAWILTAHVPSGAMSAYLHGPLIAPPQLALVIAVLPASGTASIPLTVPALSPAFQTLDVVLQGAFVATGGGGIYLSDPSRLIILGSEF